MIYINFFLFMMRKNNFLDKLKKAKNTYIQRKVGVKYLHTQTSFSFRRNSRLVHRLKTPAFLRARLKVNYYIKN
jgi:hypothetical protein